MSTALYVVIPFALLAIVSSLCFIGCGLETRGHHAGEDDGTQTDPGLPPYTKAIMEDARLLAYWRLNETTGTTAFTSPAGVADGEYLKRDFEADPNNNSAEAKPGKLSLGQPGMLAGETVAGQKQPCIEVNGGYVSVKNDLIAPASDFTLEAWVHVGWKKEDPAADRAVLISLEATDGSNYKGFGLLAGNDGKWKTLVGAGSSVQLATLETVMFDTDTQHLVAVYEDGEMKLYVNGVEPLSGTPLPSYVPTTGGGKLFIGAGGPHLTEPKIPFVGKIQCVAIYNGALSKDDVAKHYAIGTTSPP